MAYDHLYAKPKALDATKRELTAKGAEVLPLTNEWEVLRFRCRYGVGVVYVNARGKFSPNEAASKAFGFLARQEKGSLARVAVDTRSRGGAKERIAQLRPVFERDGPGCFYCALELELTAPRGHPRHATREHLVALTTGGPDHLANMFAACDPCNGEAGHLSAAEKIALRDRKRGHVFNPAASAALTCQENEEC